MAELTMGANAPIDGTSVSVLVTLPAGVDIDITALLIYPDGKVRGDGDMCFYGQPEVAGGAVKLVQGPSPTFPIDLNRLPGDVEKIVFTATSDSGRPFGQLGDVTLAASGHTLPILAQGRSEAALILAELYKRNGAWKIRNVGQGFNGGLKQLAEHFGVEVADDSPAPPPPSPTPAPPPPTPTPTPPPSPTPPRPVPPPPSPTPSARPSVPPPSPAPSAPPPPGGSINLSKISLTKQDKTVSLTKSSGKFGKIRINLNWNQRTEKRGLFGGSKPAIDLDLGAFVELSNGERGVVQALGNAFGDYNYEPYVRLLGDDRTGAVSDGEWLEINGDQWSNIRRILVYAFIYEGVPNWQETDGIVRLLVPDQPEVEVRMNEFGSRDAMCAVAELVNDGSQIRVERKVEFFRGQRLMDEAYGWGFNWRTGQK